jgi:6-phosphofructo-2-kinase
MLVFVLTGLRRTPLMLRYDFVQAFADFKARIAEYEKVYVPITDGQSNRHIHFIQLNNMVTGRGYMDINRISGYLPGKIVFFLMQASPFRPNWLSLSPRAALASDLMSWHRTFNVRNLQTGGAVIMQGRQTFQRLHICHAVVGHMCLQHLSRADHPAFCDGLTICRCCAGVS